MGREGEKWVNEKTKGCSYFSRNIIKNFIFFQPKIHFFTIYGRMDGGGGGGTINAWENICPCF